MVITDVKIYPIREKGPVLAFVSVEFDHCFVVKEIRLVKQGNRFLVAMPSKEKQIKCASCKARINRAEHRCVCGTPLPPLAEGESVSFDIAHPIKKDFRTILDSRVVHEYLKTNPDQRGSSL